jgi:hypothetical protein
MAGTAVEPHITATVEQYTPVAVAVEQVNLVIIVKVLIL